MTPSTRAFWTRNRVLAMMALILGAAAIFANPEHATGGSVTINIEELATIVEREVDHVTAAELAHWILQGRSDYRLLDLRSAEEYRQYHIPSAENVPLTGLADYPLWRNERIVLYSGGGIHSAQAWFLLRARKFPGTTILLGGLEAWKDEILFPQLPDHPTARETAAFEQARFVSESFGGSPRSGDALVATPEMPRITMPATPPPVAVAKKKKSKEGC